MIVGIADLGIGNFAAMAKMVSQLGGDPRRMTSPDELSQASHVILPGVGSFDYAAAVLDSSGFREPLMRILQSGTRPVLCVCVGMQLLAEASDEGEGAGLGWLRGRCVKFASDPAGILKVPHMGWNDVTPTSRTALFPELDEEERFYFVHSYHVSCDNPEDVAATADYGIRFTAAVARDQVMGVQFHPEKSHRFGLRLLRRFLDVRC